MYHGIQKNIMNTLKQKAAKNLLFLFFRFSPQGVGGLILLHCWKKVQSFLCASTIQRVQKFQLGMNAAFLIGFLCFMYIVIYHCNVWMENVILNLKSWIFTRRPSAIIGRGLLWDLKELNRQFGDLNLENMPPTISEIRG